VDVFAIGRVGAASLAGVILLAFAKGVMSQFLSQSMNQQMRMEQRLTPQLIQSMAILQKPVADLEAYINDAMESNAALELEEPSAEEATGRPTHEPAARRSAEDDDGRGFARLDRFARDANVDWSDLSPFQARRADYGADRDAKLGALANTAGREVSLQEHLLSQWALFDLDDPIREAGEVIINALDLDGYLRVPLGELAAKHRPPFDSKTMEGALRAVQRLEPAGIGARDLIECLRLQLNALPGDNQIERKLVEQHLDDVVHNRLPAISRATGYSIGEINEAIRAMRTSLHLHPGYLVVDRAVPPIRPDVIIDYADTGGGLTVQLARGNLPKLRVNEEVQAMAKTRKNGRDTREFARKHVESATALIDAVAFRKQRLLDVARAIAEKQQDFFDIGPEGLKVFRMSSLAVELGCDPSTVSRTVADKYVQTPRGIFPLRYFFTGGTENEEGESMGWDRVKTRVRELIEHEDRTTPLNDDEIAARLKDEGMEISRRTVAKYRQQLSIPNARQRRVYQT